jgi:class I fructose-bisphosphate aldolase
MNALATAPASVGIDRIASLLGDTASYYLNHEAKVPSSALHHPGGDYVERIYSGSDRPTPVLRSLQSIVGHGRLAHTGYVSILPVDQGIEHSAGQLRPNPIYFDGENIVKLAIEGGCNAVASAPTVCWAAWRASTPTRSPSS